MVTMQIETTPEDEQLIERLMSEMGYNSRDQLVRDALDFMFSPEGRALKARLDREEKLGIRQCPNAECDAIGHFPVEDGLHECPACGATWDTDANV